jgi:hypothetical protein
MRFHDHLGHLVPPSEVTEADLEHALVEAMDRSRFAAGLGIPSVPTRYVVRLHPADRAWLEPSTEDILARALARHAEDAGYLIVGDLEIELEAHFGTALRRPTVWAGFAETDLLVLASPRAAADVFAAAH